jgi:tetratricopeptide (TPR) repeat protein
MKKNLNNPQELSIFNLNLSPKWLHWLICLLITVVVIFVYAGSLQGDFVMDDNFFVKNNLYVRSLSNIPEAFSNPIGIGGGTNASKFYRPLQTVTNMLDYSLWRLRPGGYHISNVFWHIAACLSLYLLLFIFFGDIALAFLATFLFAVFPAHTEVVDYISGRSSSIVAFFMFASLSSYVIYNKRRNFSFYLLSLLFFAAMLLTKENAIIFPFILLLSRVLLRSKPKTYTVVPFFIVLSGYFVLRHYIVGSDFAVLISGLPQRLPGAFAALANYLRILIMPLGLHYEYGNHLYTWSDPLVLIGVAIFVSTVLISFKARRKTPIFFFSAGWFIVTMVPNANIYPVFSYMAEHYLYIPSVGFFLVLAYFLTKIYRIKKYRILACIISGLIISFYATLTIKQHSYWQNPIIFYQHNLRYSPESSRMTANLGKELLARGRGQEAIPVLKKALTLDKDSVVAMNNLGNAYASVAQYSLAREMFQRALGVAGKDAGIYNNIGIMYTEAGQYQKAVKAFKAAIRVNPDYADSYYNLGLLYLDYEEPDLACNYLEKVIKYNPYHYRAHYSLFKLYKQRGEIEKAGKHFNVLRSAGFSWDEILRDININ